MLRLLQFLFTGCFHKWEQISTGYLYEDEDDKYPTGSWYDCKCSKCGCITRFTTGG